VFLLFFSQKKKLAMAGSGSSIQLGNRRGMAREVGGNDPWAYLHPFCKEKWVRSVECGCCGTSAQTWMLELGVDSIGRGKKKFSYTRMLRVACR
jgi:hypothetical protein